MKTTLILLLSVALLSCKKETIHRERELELSEFATLFDIGKTYAIASYTDTLGNALPIHPAADADNRYIFEATNADRNARVYNTTKQTLCFFHWQAYAHPQGWVTFECVDFDLTPTYYKVMDYNIQQGYFVVQYNNTVITFKLI